MTAFNQDVQSLPLLPQVRAARTEDLPHITDLLTHSFYPPEGWVRWVYPVLKLGIYEDIKQRLRSQKPHYACLVATVSAAEATIVGTVEIACRQPYLWQSAPPHLYLSNLAVRPGYRRRGIARQLLKTCEAVAQDWGYRDLYLHVMEDNVRARTLYRQAGYQLQTVEETPLTWTGLAHRRLLLHRPLKSS